MRTSNGIWKYKELLPVDARYSARMHEGGTPLIKAERLGKKLGFSKLYLKDETRNPSASFKDRSMSVGTAKALEMGMRRVVTASSGNAAASLAAYSAKLGFECEAFVPEDISEAKLAQLCIFGARVRRVAQANSGMDPAVKYMLNKVKRNKQIYPCPSFGPFNPYQVEGPKTISFEIIEQMNWQVPDLIFAPTGSGCLLTGLFKGLSDFMNLGFISSYPRLVATQPKGNQALVQAIVSGTRFEEIQPEKHPKSIASGLLDPYPWDGDSAIKGVRTTHGYGVAIQERKIIEAVRLLASNEGVFAEPSGAIGLAAARQMLEEGLIKRDEFVVVLVTGSGLKAIDAITAI